MASSKTAGFENSNSKQKPPQKAKAIVWQKLLGALIIIMALVGLTIIAVIFWDKLFKPKSLAQFLPSDKTIAFAEINIDYTSQPVQDFLKILSQYEPYQPDNLQQLGDNILQGNLTNVFSEEEEKSDAISSTIGISSTDAVSPTNASAASNGSKYTIENISPWIGRQVGIAWLYLPEEKNEKGLKALTPVIIVEVKDQKLGQQFAEEQKNEFSWRGNNYSFKIINNHLFLAEQASILTQVESWVNKKEVEKLNDNVTYRKVAQNIPQSELGFGYIQWHLLWNILEEDKLFMQEKSSEWLAFKPFLQLLDAEGISLVINDGRFGAQTFTALNNQNLAGKSLLTFSEKYQGELLPLAPADPVFLIGGHDLTKELSRMQDIFSAGTKSSKQLFEGLIEAQKNQYFGKQMNLEEDIYPLLSGEYLLMAEGSFQKPVVTLVIEFDDLNNDRALWKKAVDAFVDISGIFTPKIQEVTLPDGTKGKEIVAQSEQIKRDMVHYNDVEITDLSLGNTGQSLHFAMLDEAVAISNDTNALHQLIDRYQARSNESMTNTQYYQRAIKPVLRTSDELLQLKLGALLEPFGINKNEKINKYLVPFNNFFMAKNFFGDGISTIYLVEVL